MSEITKDNQQPPDKKKAFFDTNIGKVLLLVIGAFAGGSVSEPIKNYINRAHVAAELVSIVSTTPPKSSWKMNLGLTTKNKLMDDIAGPDWTKDVASGAITYGAIESRRDDLASFRANLPAILKHAAWQGDPNIDHVAFYETNRNYIRTVLRYIPASDKAQKQAALHFLKQDARDSGGIIGRFLLGPPKEGPPLNTADIIRFAGQFQEIVREKTNSFFEALETALDGPLFEPMPSFEVTVDATNLGGRATSLGSVGGLYVSTPGRKTATTAIILAVASDAGKVAVLAPGQRERLRLSTKVPWLSGDALDPADASVDFVDRLQALQKKQFDALSLLGNLYKSSASHCRVKLYWGDNGISESHGIFGDVQALDSLEVVVNTE